MAKQTLSGSINCTKIDKQRLGQGKFLNFVIFLKDEPDQYGNNGMICESVSKEERQAGTKGAILGNIKIISGGGSQQQAAPVKQQHHDDDDLPF